MNNLAEDVEEMFGRLGGCLDTTEDWRNLSITVDLMAARERAKSSYHANKKAISKRKRTINLRNNLVKWMTEAKMVCVGRSLDPAEYDRVLKNPVAITEFEACVDFIYFLRVCRNCNTPSIAAMLETTEDFVTTALFSRGIGTGIKPAPKRAKAPKLSPLDVIRVKALLAKGKTQKEIAQLYGVSQSHIQRTVRK